MSSGDRRPPAATEHREVKEMPANIVFINIDWKEGRMHNTLSTNMSKLKDMIKGVVKKMQPTMICMCEVGEAGRPLSMRQMQQVADEVSRTWKAAATEHIQLCSMFEKGAPYMTVYIKGCIECSKHRILRDLYNT